MTSYSNSEHASDAQRAINHSIYIHSISQRLRGTLKISLPNFIAKFPDKYNLYLRRMHGPFLELYLLKCFISFFSP